MSMRTSNGRLQMAVLLVAGALALALAAAACSTGSGAKDGVESVAKQREALVSLPTGWSSVDISVPDAGTAEYDPTNGAFVVPTTGAGGLPGPGSNLFEGDGIETDRYRFVFRHVQGDVEVVARLKTISGDFDGASLGVTLRSDVSHVDGTSLLPDTPNPRMAAATMLVSLTDSKGNTLSSAMRSERTYAYEGGLRYDRRTSPAGTWFRIRRIGKDFSVERRSGNDAPWESCSYVGGEFRSVGAFAGFFVAAAPTKTLTATFDNVYVGPPRMAHRTTWIGASARQESTAYLPPEISTLLWYADRLYAVGPHQLESNYSNVMRIDTATGAVARLRTPVGLTLGAGIPQGAVAGGSGNKIYAAGFYYESALEKYLNNISAYTTSSDPTQDLQPVLLPAATPLGLTDIGGMTVVGSKIYVTQPDPNHLTDHVSIVDTATLALSSPSSFPVPPRPSAITWDSLVGGLWVVHAATNFPNLSNFDVPPAPSPPAFVRCYQLNGTRCLTSQGLQMPDLVINESPRWNPVAIAYQAAVNGQALNRLLVADNGPKQQIRMFDAPTGQYIGATGVDYGAYSGTTGSGLVASVGQAPRFYNLVGVAAGLDGSVFVVTDARPGGHILKIGFNGLLAWNVLAQTGSSADVSAFDSNGDAYTSHQRFAFNAAATVPGTDFSLKAITWNPFVADPNKHPPEPSILRTVGGSRVLYTSRMNYTYGEQSPGCYGYGHEMRLHVYRFVGELAKPAGRLRYCRKNDSSQTAKGELTLWTDLNLNGLEDPGEKNTTPFTGLPSGESVPSASYIFPDIDFDGNIWLTFSSVNNLSMPRIWKFSAIGMLSGAPQFTLDAGTHPTKIKQYQVPSVRLGDPTAIGPAGTSHWDKSTDTLYVVGGGRLGAYGGWESSAQFKRFPERLLGMPSAGDRCVDKYDQIAQLSYAMDVSGDKIFLPDTCGDIFAYETSDGTFAGTLTPGAQVSGRQGHQALGVGIRSARVTSGEYLVTGNDFAAAAGNKVYRWMPGTCFWGSRPETPLTDVGCSMSDDCRGAWDAEDGVGSTFFQDSSPSANHASLSGGTSWAPGREGLGLSFPTPSARAHAASHPNLDIEGPITLALWAKPTQPARFQFLVKKGAPSSASDGYELGILVDGRPYVRFNELSASTTPTDPCGPGCLVVGPAALDKDLWTHVAATYDRATVRLYVNGVQVAQKAFKEKIHVNTMRLGIGAQCATGGTACMAGIGTQFTGTLDAVRVYARALPPEQLKLLARKDPVGAWNFDDYATDMTATPDLPVTDSSGSCSGGLALNGASLLANSGYQGVGKGLRLDGVDDGANQYVEVSNAIADFNVGYSFTLAAWITMPAAQTNAPFIISKAKIGSVDGYELGIHATHRPYVRLAQASFTNSEYRVVGGTVLSTNRWYHVAATYDGDALKLYLDGALQGTLVLATQTPPLARLKLSNMEPLTIGAQTAARPYNGTIDQVRVYRRDIGACCVKKLYNPADTSCTCPY
jgi:hypothetical protein